MKMSTATLIFAVAALAAPAAVGQSQGIPFESLRPAVARSGETAAPVRTLDGFGVLGNPPVTARPRSIRWRRSVPGCAR